MTSVTGAAAVRMSPSERVSPEEMERRRANRQYYGLDAGADVRRGDWMDRAACRGMDVEVFFPLGTGTATDIQVEEAKVVCRGCPVRVQCLERALAIPISHGIVGGLDEDERSRLRKQGTRRRRVA